MTLGQTLNAINGSKYREDFIKFLGNFQTNSVNNRQTRNHGGKKVMSDTIKGKIIKMYQKDNGITGRAVCKNLSGKVNARVSEEFIEFYKQYGMSCIEMEFKPKPIHGLSDEHVAFLIELASDPKNIGLSLKERKHILCNHFKIKSKTNDVREALKENGYSMKRIRSVVPEADNIPHKNARCRVTQ